MAGLLRFGVQLAVPAELYVPLACDNLAARKTAAVRGPGWPATPAFTCTSPGRLLQGHQAERWLG